MKQSMLEPDDEGKVKGARGTTRVKGKSYRQGTIYISSEHKDLGHMEVWMDWATIQFRVFGPAATCTGSFCVFGPVLSSPAHALTSLAMH